MYTSGNCSHSHTHKAKGKSGLRLHGPVETGGGSGASGMLRCRRDATVAEPSGPLLTPETVSRQWHHCEQSMPTLSSAHGKFVCQSRFSQLPTLPRGRESCMSPKLQSKWLCGSTQPHTCHDRPLQSSRGTGRAGHHQVLTANAMDLPAWPAPLGRMPTPLRGEQIMLTDSGFLMATQSQHREQCEAALWHLSAGSPASWHSTGSGEDPGWPQ